MTQPLRIGLVGANPNRSWAMLSHLPAIKAIPGIELTAVATSNLESAAAAAAAFGVDEYYAGAQALAESPNVDIVSVSVRVPFHAEMVRAAIRAGKHVLCEWPLALNVEEAEALRDEAAAAGVHCGVGLQGRMNLAVRRARQIVASGALGRILTLSAFDSTQGHGPALPACYAYLCDEANGATMSTISTGHLLDTAIFIVGGLTELQAMGTIKWRQVKLTDEDGYVERNTPDHLAIMARFSGGGQLNAELDGGRLGETPFRLEIVGTEGKLLLTGAHLYGFQSGELTLESSVACDPPLAPAAPGLTGPVANVGELYARFAADIVNGEHCTPDFVHAATLHRLLRSVKRALDSGQRQTSDHWPED